MANVIGTNLNWNGLSITSEDMTGIGSERLFASIS